MAVDLGLDGLVNGVSKRYASGYRARVERLLEAAVRSDRNPFNDAATASAEQTTAVKTGTTIPFAGLNAPSGYLECNGAEVSKSQYDALWKAVGETYGSASDSSKFKLPNAKQAAISGAGGTRVSGVQTGLGKRFDNNTTSLTVAQMPEHRHVIDTITDENRGHVHDVTAYPNFGIAVPDGFVVGTGGSSDPVSDADYGSWSDEPLPRADDGASADQSFWERVKSSVSSFFTREETQETTDNTGQTKITKAQLVEFGYDGQTIDLNNISTLEKSIAAAGIVAATGGLAAGVVITPAAIYGGSASVGGISAFSAYLPATIAGDLALKGAVVATGGGVGSLVTGGAIGTGVGVGIYNTDGSRNAGYQPNLSGPATSPQGPGGGIAPPTPSVPSIPNVTNPPENQEPKGVPFFVPIGRGTADTNANNRTFGNIPDAPSIPSPTPPPAQRPNVPNPGAPTPGTNPDDTRRPGSAPRNTTPGTATNTKPTEDKTTAPVRGTRANPRDATLLSDSQREEFNKQIETFYEDYRERIVGGGNAFDTWIDSDSGRAGISYGLVDARSETGKAGGHTHTVSGTMDETGGGGPLGVQQPSIALMWIIKT